MSGPVRVQHFSDILCVWAYVSQVRMDELYDNFGSEVEVDYRFFQVFGDVPRKLESQWSERGGASGYAQHVAEVVEQFGHVELNRDAWSVVSPASSMPAHLLLCAVRLLDLTKVAEVAAQIRHTFFVEAKDVSRRSELLTIVESTGLVVSEVEATWDSGHAHAELSSDLNLARDKFVASSPTLLFNEDRQRLTGNVGYRVIEANVRELLRSPAAQQSWC